MNTKGILKKLNSMDNDLFVGLLGKTKGEIMNDYVTYQQLEKTIQTLTTLIENDYLNDNERKNLVIVRTDLETRQVKYDYVTHLVEMIK